MVVGMAAFSIEDALIKQLSRESPISEVLVAFGLGGAASFAFLLRQDRKRIFHPALRSRAMVVRAGFELIGRLFYFLAIALTPLSSATVILQATPVLVVLGAHFYFGESIGWRRWLAVVLGLAGVLVVVRPSSADFSVLSLLAVVGMIGFAGRDLASRAAPKELDVQHLGFLGFLTVAIAGAGYSLFEARPFTTPSIEVVGLYALAIPVGLFAYTALMNAMRTGEVGAVTPFRYSRLVFGIALGAFWFNEPLGPSVLLGCAIILASGLLISWRGPRPLSRQG